MASYNGKDNRKEIRNIKGAGVAPLKPSSLEFYGKENGDCCSCKFDRPKQIEHMAINVNIIIFWCLCYKVNQFI